MVLAVVRQPETVILLIPAPVLLESLRVQMYSKPAVTISEVRRVRNVMELKLLLLISPVVKISGVNVLVLPAPVITMVG